MGGLGSLLTLWHETDSVDGVVLISPFLGWDEVIEELDQNGGICSWNLPDIEASNWVRRLWL